MPGCSAAAHLGCTGNLELPVLSDVAPDAPRLSCTASAGPLQPLLAWSTSAPLVLPVWLKGMSQAP